MVSYVEVRTGPNLGRNSDELQKEPTSLLFAN
jgi:hypothetical protein